MNKIDTVASDLAVSGSTGLQERAKLGVTPHHLYTVSCYRDGKMVWQEKFENKVTTAGRNKYLDATLKTGLASPLWYLGLVGASITDAAITSGAAVLTSASNPFAAGDAGSAIIVKGAGAAGADLVTTILTYTNAGSVTLSANAGTTISGGSSAWDFRAADTMSSHAPWTDNANYTNATRPAWTAGSVSAGSVDNSGSPAVFNINGTTTIFGCFMTDSATVSGTTGTLMGGGVFATLSRSVISGDVINVTETLSLT